MSVEPNEIRVIPAAEHFPGMTAIRIDETREMVICATGPVALATLRAGMLAKLVGGAA